MDEIIRNSLLHNPLGIFSYFVLGLLFVVFIQNTFFYSYYKDKAYLWYALYALIVITDQLLIHYQVYTRYALGKNKLHYLIPLHTALEWLYNSAYLIFVIEFGGVYLLSKQTAKKVKQAVFISVAILVLFYLIDMVFTTSLVKKGFLYIQVPMLIILSIIIYKYLFRMKTAIKYYIIFGSLAFSIFSILALSTAVFFKGHPHVSWNFFYTGVFLENVFFSLGLVVKQRMILKERNESQKELIVQLKETESLKNQLTKKLQEEVEKQTSEIILLNRKSEEEKIKQMSINFEKEMAELKVSSLQSQMNPHFLFNSLNSIKLYIIKNDKDNAVYYLNKFSKLIRRILSASRERVVSLEEELDTLELYISIENIRFNKEIEIDFFVDETISLSTVKIPPLILQPFIENAIWHGLSPKKSLKKLSIKVVQLDKNYIQITITDNGIGRERAKQIKLQKVHKKRSVGLQITNERFTSFEKEYTRKHSIVFKDLFVENAPSGTQVIIKLPLQ